MKTGELEQALARAALLVALLPLGCHRKAPGPEECREFALRAYGLKDDDQIESEAALDQIDDLTTECLVTPYDRELLACVEGGGATGRCLSQFSARRSGAAPGNSSLRPTRKRRRDSPFP